MKKLLVLLIASALAPAARADATLGPAPGNVMNPVPVNPTVSGRWMDEDGIGTRIPSARTPTGQFYNVPLDPDGEAEEKVEGWITSIFVEMGLIGVHGDRKHQGWLNYKDLAPGGYLSSFGLQAEKPGSARFVEVTGGAVGRDDAFYRAQFGRYNDWKVSAYYDATPTVSTTSYRSLWSGVGSGFLTLDGLRPGGTTNAATTQTNILGRLAATPESKLEVQREKAGARIDAKVGDSWSLYAAVSDEKRKGSRPFGAVFGGGGGGGNMELPESIDYDTLDLAAGAQYTGAIGSFNLRASASFFRNEIDTLTFQNPVFISLNGSSGLNATTFTQGRFDLAPDNQHYNVRGEYARPLPDFYRGNLTATVSVGSMRQNEALLAPTEYPLTGGTVTAGGVSLANVWNTPAALTKQTTGARIDTALADVGLALRPASGLDVKGKLRYYETRNSLAYDSCNPLTGQWGRLLNDGSGLSVAVANTTAGTNPAGTSANAYNAAACDLAAVMALGRVPAAGNIPIRAVPNDLRQINGSVTADYRLGRAKSVTAAIERESMRRDYRERDETWEDRVKVTYVDRGTLDGTIRVSYEHGWRSGGDYDPNPYEPFLSAAMGPTPNAGAVSMTSWIHAIGQSRSFDLADRNQGVLNGRVDYALHPNVESAVTLQMKDASFPGEYGRTGHQRTQSLTFDVGYQHGSAMVLYGHYTHQRSAMDQAGIHSNACTLGTTYYFYSDGRVLNAATGATAPATPAGTTLVGTQAVAANNWREVCGVASPTSPLFPESRTWQVDSRDRSNVFGMGAKVDLGRAKLDVSLSRIVGHTRIGYSYNAAALGLTAAQVALAGDGLTDLTFSQTVLDASALVPINKRMSLRFVVRHESGRVRDWHYDGVAANPMPANNAVYLDSGPQDYRTTAAAILFHLRM